VALQFYPVRESKDLDDAFAARSKARAEALVVLPHPFMWSHTQRIVDLATRRRLPALYPYKDPVKTAEGLLAYGVDEPVYWRRIGYYVDKIFKRGRSRPISPWSSRPPLPDHQRQDRQGARRHDPAVITVTRRRGNPVER
jgi:hypothetical protein